MGTINQCYLNGWSTPVTDINNNLPARIKELSAMKIYEVNYYHFEESSFPIV